MTKEKGAMGENFRRRSNGRRGSVLVAVLWSLFFLAALALVINASITPQLGLAARLRDRVQLRSLAKAGIAAAVVQIRADETDNYDILYDPWAHNEDAFKEVPLTDDGGYFSIEHTLTQDGDEPEVHYGLLDEERRININRAPADILARFLETVAGVTALDAQSISAAVIDWRDEDDEPSENGAESEYYEGLENGYPCKNAPFEVLDELRLVRGVTQEIYDKIEGRATVYGSGSVNINTADPMVLASLGLSEDLVRNIVIYRDGDDGVKATEDDNAFTDPGTVAETLGMHGGVDPVDSDRLEALQGLIGVRSDSFQGHAVGRFPGEDVSSAVIFVIGRDEKIRYWREE